MIDTVVSNTQESNSNEPEELVNNDQDEMSVDKNKVEISENETGFNIDDYSFDIDFEKLEWSDNLKSKFKEDISGFKKDFFEKKIDPNSAKDIFSKSYNTFQNLLNNANEEFLNKQKEVQNILSEEYGDNFESKKILLKKHYEKIFDGSENKLADELFNLSLSNKDLFKSFLKDAESRNQKMFVESSKNDSGKASNFGKYNNYSPSEIMYELKEIARSKEYLDKNHPRNNEIMRKVELLKDIKEKKEKI